jgi:hypothetical protein
MKIEPPADDVGLQHLKIADRARGKVEQTDHVERSARIAPPEQQGERPLQGVDAHGKAAQPEPLPHAPQPRQGERRSGKDRRQGNDPILLDTRSPHERRIEARRAADRKAGNDDEPTGGVDELA